jgi:putative PIN family toxin of toxin-antitoxin system
VLDTNVLVSALLFPQGMVGTLRRAWQVGRCIPLASHETVTELARVLAYPKFRLDEGDRLQLLADYLPWVETVALIGERTSLSSLPSCRDPHDQIFVRLAAAGRARYLVSGDADLLAIDRIGACRVLAPAAFLETLPPA